MYLNYKRQFPPSPLGLTEVEQQLCQKAAHVSLKRTQKHCCSKEHTEIQMFFFGDTTLNQVIQQLFLAGYVTLHCLLGGGSGLALTVVNVCRLTFSIIAWSQTSFCPLKSISWVGLIQM